MSVIAKPDERHSRWNLMIGHIVPDPGRERVGKYREHSPPSGQGTLRVDCGLEDSGTDDIIDSLDLLESDLVVDDWRDVYLFMVNQINK